MFQRKWFPIWIAIPVLIIMGYYSYLSDEHLLKEGHFTISTITRTAVARGGIRTWSEYQFMGNMYIKDGVYPIPQVSLKDVGKRKFTIFYANEPNGHIILLKGVVPDTLVAPDTGWSRQWMQEHFPEVINNLDF